MLNEINETKGEAKKCRKAYMAEYYLKNRAEIRRKPHGNLEMRAKKSIQNAAYRAKKIAEKAVINEI